MEKSMNKMAQANDLDNLADNLVSLARGGDLIAFEFVIRIIIREVLEQHSASTAH